MSAENLFNEDVLEENEGSHQESNKTGKAQKPKTKLLRKVVNPPQPKPQPQPSLVPKLSNNKQNIFNAIEQEQNQLCDIGHYLWRYAETAGKELQSCKKVVDYLKHKGFRLSSICDKFDTAFRAEFAKNGKRPNIGFLCEYSADPKTGHSHGHNLVTATCVSAAIGLQRAIGLSKSFAGKVTVVGCPANSSNTFKKDLLYAGCFKNIDLLIAAYPANFTCLQPRFLASKKMEVTFVGRGIKDGVEPWEMANPVNAVVLTQQGLSALRGNFDPDWCINGVINFAGDDPCVQPEKASARFEMKAPSQQGIDQLTQKLRQCMEGASIASGCKFHEKVIDIPMKENVNCSKFVNLYRSNATLNGFTFHNEKKDHVQDPNDIAFISHAIPTFRYYYYAGTPARLGTDEFNRHCGSSEVEYTNIVQGKSLAMMACDLMLQEELLKEITEEHSTVCNQTDSMDGLAREHDV